MTAHKRSERTNRATSAASPVDPLIVARGLVHGYDGRTVLHGIDLDIRPGDVMALTGPSGSGKTTLLHLLAGVHAPWQGRIDLAPNERDGGGDIASMDTERRARLRRSRFGLVFQSGQLLDELTCEENVALPLLSDGFTADRAIHAAGQWFPTLGIEGLEKRRPGEVSGGQRQRIALARAMVTRPQVLFADEPTGALDSRTGRALMDTLLHVSRSTGMALVIVTHDPDVAGRCEQVIGLRDGRIHLDRGVDGPTFGKATASATVAVEGTASEGTVVDSTVVDSTVVEAIAEVC